MLKEIRNARQVPGELRRRWFTSATLDLIVWCDDVEVPVGFQLCCDKDGIERALTWRPEAGFSHMAVDSGEEQGGVRYKSTPILVTDGVVDVARIVALMQENSEYVPDEIVNSVHSKIGEGLLSMGNPES